MNIVEILIGRLDSICSQRGWDTRAGEIWANGLGVIQRKYGGVVYLSKCEPVGLQKSQSTAIALSIQVTTEDE